MSLKTRITEDMKTAMKRQGHRAPVGAIRLLMAAMKQSEVDERIELDDAGIVAVIEKMLKQRRDSISQYEAAKRQDLADVEKFEVEVLTGLHAGRRCPPAEIDAAVAAAVIAESGAKGPAGHGQGHGPAQAEARRPRRHGRGLGPGQGGPERQLTRRRPGRRHGARPQADSRQAGTTCL